MLLRSCSVKLALGESPVFVASTVYQQFVAKFKQHVEATLVVSIDTLPEWSKGVDSSSTSASCVGSNPTGVILLTPESIYIYSCVFL